ncbi:phage tail protein [Lyngbya sp. CCY1209]|uniref:phage tail protein n=1 Tax=Lyngbya sp. CCY1209 TaxID=2886103 RepID=UPI002D1FE9D8|nr:phage tail protein [Lyngbya sp. CCY1209]MEB3883794.1 phage tail protein [Lyngbya sp. CCY1209]
MTSMTQAPSSQSVLLDVVSIDIPETEPAQLSELSGTIYQVDSDRSNLTLIPGEVSEIVIDLENLDTRPLELSCELTGNFPPHWCRSAIAGYQLSPGERKSAVLSFRVDRNFFEEHQADVSGDGLRLNYSGRFSVYGTYPGTGENTGLPPLLEFIDFDLFLRPRSPYVNLLPQIYREIDFVGRFLKIIETTFNPDVQTFGTLWAHLDPLTAPESLLPFLAHWVGWRRVPNLSWEQQRRLIRHALEIYRWRGTRRGLRFYLHLATGLPLDEDLPEIEKHIAIVENFTQGAVMGTSYLGVDAILGGGKPFHFDVRLRGDPDAIDETLVRQVIEEQKPAFCTYELKITNNL